MNRLLFLVLSCVLLTGVGGANLLENGDFTQWSGMYPTGWLVEDTSKALVEQCGDTARSAPYAARITRLVAGTGNNKGVKQLVPVTPGEPYTLSAWFLDDDVNAGGGIGISWRDADTGYISHSGTWYTDSSIHDWQFLWKTDTAPSGAAFADCLLRVYGFTGSPAGGVVHVDDAELVQGVGAVSELPERPVRSLLRVVPNPVVTGTEILLAPAGGCPVSVAVYDRSGAKRASLFSGHSGGGRLTIDWRGTDDAGRRLPAGSYFVRVSGPGVESLAKIVLQR